MAKKIFYCLICVLVAYFLFCGYRFHKHRDDSSFVKNVLDINQLLYSKINKVDYVKDSCEHEIKKLEEQKKKNEDDKKIDVNSSEIEEKLKMIKNIQNKAKSGLEILKIKEKELHNLISKCHKGFISKKLRKEVKDYLDDYLSKEHELDKIVSDVEKPWNEYKDEQKKKQDDKSKKEGSEKI